MDEEQLSETTLVMNYLGSCFSQGYCSWVAMSLCLIIIGGSRASWCKRLVMIPYV